MALETAAAIIGILAAAGKVAETLGPYISAFKDVTKNIAAVLSEVNSSRVTLSALHKYLDNLNACSRSRRELIQVDQLIATLTDGVLLFSELEALVLSFVGPDSRCRSRIQWAWNDDKIASLVLRMQNFKTSITVMLNILQWQVSLIFTGSSLTETFSESDMEAFRSRNELFLLTSNLMKTNIELARRIAHLEDCFDTSNTTLDRRPDSLATVKMHAQIDGSTMMQETNDRFGLLPYGTTPGDEQERAFTSSRGHQGDMNMGINFEFEKVLFSSRVYHSAKRQTSDVSFRSSVGRSHAWTAISDISLSNISNVSVIALPLTLKDVSNQQHYTFRPTTVEAEPTIGEGINSDMSAGAGPMVYGVEKEHLLDSQRSLGYLELDEGVAQKLGSRRTIHMEHLPKHTPVQPSAAHVDSMRSKDQGPTKMTLIIKGSASGTMSKIVERVHLIQPSSPVTLR